MVVDGYTILEYLGQGGMGVVFKVRQPQTGQVVCAEDDPRSRLHRPGRPRTLPA